MDGELIHKQCTDQIIRAAIEVHRHLGPGLLESTYDFCLFDELCQSGIRVARQVDLPVLYKGRLLDCGYRIDLLVEDEVIVEVKSVEKLAPIHAAQLMSYLRLSGKQVGLLLNFNVKMMIDGIMRRALSKPSSSSAISAISAVSAVSASSAVNSNSRDAS